jgi:NAD(P)-dependent dehydrogenase (short-subunit alcohol dehydrogenase family)
VAPAQDEKPSIDYHDAIALVTGAGRGIGRAVARRLSDQGLRVALTARSEDQLQETAAECVGPTLVLPMDISSAGAPDLLVADVSKLWGPVAVLVANAGTGFSARVERTSDADWERVIDLNLNATFRCMRAVIPAMRDAAWGRIITIASIASKVGEPYLSAYSASKHGVLGLVRSAAMELAPGGVTVNAICPGYVDTPMTDATVEGIVRMTSRTAAEARRILEAKQPTGRLVSPDEVAEAVWMCIANSSINGQGVNVDGGMVQS